MPAKPGSLLRSTRAWSSNRRTIQSYTESAREYDRQVSARPPRYIAGALRRMMKHVPAGGLVLEVGSGTGRDADFIESLGGKVRRTDATQAFLDLQAERGKNGERLNLLRDTLGASSPWTVGACSRRSCSSPPRVGWLAGGRRDGRRS